MTKRTKPQPTFAAMLLGCQQAQTTKSKERKSAAFWKRFADANDWKLFGWRFEHSAIMTTRTGASVHIEWPVRDALIKWMDTVYAD